MNKYIAIIIISTLLSCQNYRRFGILNEIEQKTDFIAEYYVQKLRNVKYDSCRIEKISNDRYRNVYSKMDSFIYIVVKDTNGIKYFELFNDIKDSIQVAFEGVNINPNKNISGGYLLHNKKRQGFIRLSSINYEVYDDGEMIYSGLKKDSNNSNVNSDLMVVKNKLDAIIIRITY